jgi:hypothetical protein
MARPRSRARWAARIAVWVLGLPAALLLLLYLVLLVTPVPLPFGSNATRAIVMSTMPPTTDLQLGSAALALEGGVWPVIRFSPVVLDDTRSGARIGMDALEVGFSPMRALVGQPGATVTIVGPRVQMVQDLFGPRATRFELVEDAEGGTATIRVLEGLDAFPSVDISENGVLLGGELPPVGESGLRSDNDWLIYNLESAERGLADVLEQSRLGRFSRLVVRDATISMTDSVYGLFRTFEDVDLDLTAGRDGETIEGDFTATLSGRTLQGSLSRSLGEEGEAILQSDITNIDFASVVPFVDDPESIAAIKGAGAVSIDVSFDKDASTVRSGAFKIDLTGLDLRLKDDFFPIASSILDITWDPDSASFTLAEGNITVGDSAARVSGTFALGLDPMYGPTIGMAMTARDVVIHPSDMEAPDAPFDTMEFSGWSAPLYGAVGIDRWAATKGDGMMEASGRIDMLRRGIGFDMSVGGQGITADDLKRLWPYVMGESSRDWFVANVTEGVVADSSMRFRFPVGSVSIGEEDDRPLPEGAMQVDIVGTGVAIRATDDMAPIGIDGDMVLQLRDSDLMVSAAGGTVPTDSGPITVTSPAVVMDSVGEDTIFEISGDVAAGIPALIDLVEMTQPEALESADLPLDPAALEGDLDVGVLATIRLADEARDVPMQVDYVLNGTVSDFASSEPIEDRRFDNGQLQFSASQSGYQVAGTADIDGVGAEVMLTGTPETEPQIRLAATVSVEDLAAMGFDASEFLSGSARLVAQPTEEGGLDIAIDLTDAGLTVSDLGIEKAAGTQGTLRALVAFGEDGTTLDDIELAFGDVRLNGTIVVGPDQALESAEFSTFRLSAGDNARVAMAPISGGFNVTMRGAQLDLKPMLGRFFDLGQGSGGIETTQLDQAIVLDIELDRVVGFYGTTAFNVDLDLSLDGSDMRRANVSASFAEGNSLSITTNPTPSGRVMSMAFNDAGTILRLLGVYSQVAGGSGSLVLNRNTEQDIEVGELVIQNFSIIDEENVAQVLGNHSNSRAMIERSNRLDFEEGRVTFQRTDGRVEVTDAMLGGDMVGGTLRGTIYTDERRYDLAGTYVPLFGLNNAFQQIPLFGPLLGGRDGEGLLGVTFAVRGPLDNPEFRVNPLSALAPGFFRELFEFRTQESGSQ